jgi:hypothetical protein
VIRAEVSVMRLGLRDVVAALLVAAIIAPYAGLLLRGRVPYVESVQMMAAVALVLGTAAFLIADHISLATIVGRAEVYLALLTFAIGVTTMALAPTAAGQPLLGAFVTGILLTWGIQLLDHAGYAPRPRDPAAGRRNRNVR